MAVADVFTALSEDRPYRRGLEKDKIMMILNDMVKTGGLDKDINEQLKLNFDRVTNRRKDVQQTSGARYQQVSHKDKRLTKEL